MTPPPDLLSLIDKANSLQPNTKRSYKNAVRLWLDFAGDNPRGWTVAAAQAFYNSLVERTSIPHANGIVTGGLAYALRRAVALNWRGVRDVTAAIDKKKQHSGGEADEGAGVSGGRALRPSEAVALLAACNGPELNDKRDRAAILLGLYTGMRRMSLVAVGFSRVKTHGEFVTIHVPIKGGAGYNVPLDARAWAELTTYVTALRRAGGNAATGPLFPPISQRRPTAKDPIGQVVVQPRYMSTDGLRKALKTRADAAGIPDFHPHMLRHTFATWCRLAKVDDYIVEVVTGHQGGQSIVDRVYFDRNAAMADAAVRCYEAVTVQLMKGNR